MATGGVISYVDVIKYKKSDTAANDGLTDLLDANTVPVYTIFL